MATVESDRAVFTARGGDPWAPVVFWGLLTLAGPIFALCVLAPEWNTYESMRAAERAERLDLARLEREVERQRRELIALQDDPAVLRRMAQRELGYERAGARVVPVLWRVDDGRGSEAFPAIGPSGDGGYVDERWDESGAALGDGGRATEAIAKPRAWGALAAQWVVEPVFCREPTRSIVFVMSTALIAVAYALFWRRGTGRP
jgi:hypothetical protein